MVMAANFLEQLVAEWYEYQGYFVRRNVHVGKLATGGFAGELDVVVFQPETREVVHVESSMDADSWQKRQLRFAKKFAVGKKYIPTLFSAFKICEKDIKQIALFGITTKGGPKEIGGGTVDFASDLLIRVLNRLKRAPVTSQAVPESFPILRAMQFISMPGTRAKIISMWAHPPEKLPVEGRVISS